MRSCICMHAMDHTLVPRQIKFGIEPLNSDLASIPRFIFVSSVQFVASEPMLLLRFVASVRFVASELTLLLRFVASVRLVASELTLLQRFVALHAVVDIFTIRRLEKLTQMAPHISRHHVL